MSEEIRRNCAIIIRQMIDKIPAEKTEFIKDLEWNYEDTCYKAPEENIQWQRTMLTLRKHIPTPILDWEYEILSIFTTRPIEELKKIS